MNIVYVNPCLILSYNVYVVFDAYKNRYKKLGPRDARKSDSMHLVFSASSGLKLLLLHLEFQKFSQSGEGHIPSPETPSLALRPAPPPLIWTQLRLWGWGRCPFLSGQWLFTWWDFPTFRPLTPPMGGKRANLPQPQNIFDNTHCKK